MKSPGIIDRDNDPLWGVQFVDCDAHFTEPADLWTSRIPATSRVRAPELKTVDGETNWYIGEERFACTGGNTVRRGGERVRGLLASIQPFDDIDESAWSVPARLEMMDSIGSLAQVIYPNAIGFSSNYIFTIDDPLEREAILKTYNDFYADIQHDSGQRLLPQGMLPIWDMGLTLKEMTRLIERGMTGFTLSDKPEMLGLPELLDPYFDPMWDLFNESGTVASFHVASGATKAEMEHQRRPEEGVDENTPKSSIATLMTDYLPPQRRITAVAAQFFMSNARVISNLCLSNLFDRYSNLKIASAESGIGWIPFVLEALEFLFDENVVDNSELRWAKRRPKEYFSDHIYVMYFFEKLGPRKLLHEIGIRNVMVETDFPHPACFYPSTRERLALSLEGVDPQSCLRVLRDNAVELYGINVPTV